MRAYAWPLVVSACASLLLFPWMVTAVLALLAAVFVPLLPLALGMLADALYLPPHAWPLATLAGLIATLAAFLVRRRLSASIM